MSTSSGPLTGPAHAVGFLTRVPVALGDGPPELRRAVPWFPVVGAAVGGVAAGVLALVDLIPGTGPAGVAAALALAAGVAVTGGLHEDGLADVADGLGVLGDRTRRLAAMRDPRLGAFGVVALALWLLVTWSALRGLSIADGVRALVAAGVISRTAILLHVATGRPARPDGALHALHVGPVGGTIAEGLAVVGALLLLGLAGGAVALAVGALVGLALGAIGARALGGITGDTCGAVAALVQATTLIVALGFAG